MSSRLVKRRGRWDVTFGIADQDTRVGRTSLSEDVRGGGFFTKRR